MSFDSSEWGLPLAVAIAGLLVGWFLNRTRGSSDPDVAKETRRIDLESTRDDVVDALKLLEIDRDKMTPAEYAEERQALLSRGAKALAALEGAGGPSHVEETVPKAPRAPAPTTPGRAAPAPSGTSPGGMSPEWRGALTALGVVAVLFALWQFATRETVVRQEGASMTGNQSLGTQQDPSAAFRESPQYKEAMAEIEAKLAANENDLEALNKATHLQLNAGQPAEAMQMNDRALKVDEKNADARTYRAILQAMMGMEEMALQQLDAVLADNPDHTRATIFRSMVLYHLGRGDEAVRSLEAARMTQPSNGEIIRQLESLKQALAADAGAPAAPAGGDRLVAGTITLDPASTAALKGNETLFLSIADPAKPKPPIAADKKAGPLQFPMPFELTTAHIRAMPGAGGMPDVLDLKVKVDLDGNAMTQEPGAPSAMVTGITRGASGLAVTLSLSGAPVAAPPSAQGAPPPAGGGLVAPIAPPSGAGGGGDVLAAGRADLAPARASAVTGNEIVFVSVKDPSGGPPLAVSRVPARFPLDFRVTTADVIPMMAGRPIPDTVVVSVRVDKDGNASTKDGEPEAVAQGVQKGSAQLQLTLQ